MSVSECEPIHKAGVSDPLWYRSAGQERRTLNWSATATETFMKAQRLEAQFASRSAQTRGGLLLFQSADAIDLIRSAADEGVPILGINGIRQKESMTASPVQHLADYSRHVADGHGCWAEAEAYVREREHADLLFAGTLGV